MNGTITPTTGRSVQLAVMAARSTSVLEAVAAARRTSGARTTDDPRIGWGRRPLPAASA